ncbi:2,3-bisphosphoglycerate-independent phosphoglycerate mutase-like [Parasteatoda tepidariorum]|uniref:2,3-bisphosphoglycerate-independent phosphoglycerate mutase-like n=1 Tax=Parasteatoda tepidariorum TaxID=114398 RepID=UPI001C71D596|nr:2,3-bisphosphoglycerate-independent phosphoglycerate mutase-like [Parasteatoda tepidariorum]
MNNLCLIVIDGWGLSEEKKGNAIFNAHTPIMDDLSKDSSNYLTLDASGLSVGLPEGLMGNSEVGHMNIGAGRVMEQDILRINKEVENKEISKNPNFIECANNAKSKNGRLHFLGLVSDGGVHAHIDHLFALLEAAKEHEVAKTFIHFFSDGRDTSPTCAFKYVQQTLDKCKELNHGCLATITGRYYAMDRDKNHERIKLAYEGMVQGKGEKTNAEEVVSFIKTKYEDKSDPQSDEDLKPIIVNQEGLIQDDDTLLFINYRADRMRQITEAFGMKPEFETGTIPKNLMVCTMTQYKKDYPFIMLFPPRVPKNVLSEWISKKGCLQFHCAETEKYAHVTFFFNGGQEAAFENETRKMVPSPKVATYDLQPEMSCMKVADEMVKAIKSGRYHFVLCNLAPPDMVGHTGKYEPALRAVEATDRAIGRIVDACVEMEYELVITADHGNAEKMLDENGEPCKTHTTNRVPFIVRSSRKLKTPDHNAALCDVAPTILDLMGLDKPPEMTGRSLLA